MNFGPMSLSYKSLQLGHLLPHLASVISMAPFDLFYINRTGERQVSEQKGVCQKIIFKNYFCNALDHSAIKKKNEVTFMDTNKNKKLGKIEKGKVQNLKINIFCTLIFIAALFMVAMTWKQLKHPTIDDWLKKLWYIYTMKYYSPIRRDEILPFATTWMDLNIIMLSEISQKKLKVI
uniref:DUF1725 domain-containing protein n=1 Tax=Rousettus aegyptiacus TaxID=9407 RepID=A0A7J8GAG3_ROUAE|nr:hypothetical protein HJG63_011478 [Rousettus aegyptiacus]